MNLICPDCEFHMMQVDGPNYVVDHCAKCGGIWFDPDEIADYVDGVSFYTDATDLDDDYLPGRSGVHVQDCPRCKKHSLQQGLLNDLSFSRCDECGGFFLSRDQISLVIRDHTRSPSAIELVGDGLVEGGIELVMRSVVGALGALF